MSKVIECLEPFATEKYESISLDNLVIYAAYVATTMQIELSFENLVVASFMLFPKKFSLLGYPTYPDAKRIHHVLRRCTYVSSTHFNRGWLRGKFSQGFELTDSGYVVADETMKLLEVGVRSAKHKTLSQTRREERILDEVCRSPAFVRYTQGKLDAISNSDCCHTLQCTLDSDRHVREGNLRQLKSMAVTLEKKDLVEFLDWLETHFRPIIRGTK